MTGEHKPGNVAHRRVRPSMEPPAPGLGLRRLAGRPEWGTGTEPLRQRVREARPRLGRGRRTAGFVPAPLAYGLGAPRGAASELSSSRRVFGPS